MKLLKKGLILLCLLGLLASFAGCSHNSDQPAEPIGKVYFNWFDTVTYVYSYAGDPAERFEERSAGISGILTEYHQLFDIYHEYSGINNLCTVNRLAGGDPVPVDPKLMEFLLYARELYDTTGGEMNILMGSVLTIWHDHRTAATENPAAASLPELSALEAAATHTDFSLLEIDEQNGTVRLADPEASIDVGALGKGYATEMAARWLEEQGIGGYVLNVGGNIRIVGQKPDGSGWKTAIKDPKDPDNSYAAILDLQDTACVTSGIYERFFTVEGKQYHHVIDRDTLFPAAQFASVSIVTKDSGLADALSTALFCMPYEDGRALADRLGVQVLWIEHDGTLRYTDGMQALMTN